MSITSVSNFTPFSPGAKLTSYSKATRDKTMRSSMSARFLPAHANVPEEVDVNWDQGYIKNWGREAMVILYIPLVNGMNADFSGEILSQRSGSKSRGRS